MLQPGVACMLQPGVACMLRWVASACSLDLPPLLSTSREDSSRGVKYLFPSLQVYNPKNKLQQAFVITLGRAGEDNRSFRLTNIDSTLEGFAGADYDMLVGPYDQGRAHSRSPSRAISLSPSRANSLLGCLCGGGSQASRNISAPHSVAWFVGADSGMPVSWLSCSVL